MNKKIELKNIDQHLSNGINEVKYELSVNEKNYQLTYKITGIDVPVAESFDTVVVSFLYYAMTEGYDFYSKYPVSERLYYNITKQLLPQLFAANHGKIKPFNIVAPRIIEKFEGGGGRYRSLVRSGFLCHDKGVHGRCARRI